MKIVCKLINSIRTFRPLFLTTTCLQYTSRSRQLNLGHCKIFSFLPMQTLSFPSLISAAHPQTHLIALHLIASQDCRHTKFAQSLGGKKGGKSFFEAKKFSPERTIKRCHLYFFTHPGKGRRGKEKNMADFPPS